MNQIEDLADYIRRIINEKDLTLREIEERSGGAITHGYISKILSRAVTNLSVEKLQALAKGLGISEEVVFAVARGKALDGDPEFEKSEIAALFYDYKDLTEEDQKDLRVIWEMLGVEIKRRKKTSKKRA